MKDNHINYKEKLDALFAWFEENKYEPEYNDKGKEINREFNLVCQFADWVEDGNNFDTIIDITELNADFKDSDDFKCAAGKLCDIAIKGVETWLKEGKWWNK